ncbi:O-antigen ligase family protein [Bradyrhizobium huanghuaihaiense]|uniref:O-antigen ligase family protein n=1 Tax=Bradyrhizobium huanghuaihaiense TaxID=990078 RepID=UPI0021AA13CB|nr:O-antigen ligase family protein [Bradyrhizobium sp. CB3035]UWU74817.1 O-antigen ligase family protein [Bradyrhizobium sp. CB3035]
MTGIILALTGLLLSLTRILGVRQMMLAVMLVRPACDRAFDWLKAASEQQTGPGAAINALVIAIAIVTIIHVPGIVLSAPLLAWASVLLTAAASLVHAPDPSGGLRDLLALFTYAAVFTLPYALVRTKKMATQCLVVALCSSAVPSIFALLELAMQPDILTGEQRLQSTFTHPNIYAFYIVSVVTVILYMLCSANFTLSPIRRRAVLAYAGFLLFLLLLTKARSAWLSMVIITAGYAVLVDRRWLLAILCLPVLLLFPAVGERLSDLKSGTVAVGFEQLNSLAWREVLWNDTLEWLTANPPGLNGYGLNSYKAYVPLFFSRGDGEVRIGPHNAILQIYFEMGMAGLASFGLLWGTVVLEVLSTWSRDFRGALTMSLLCAGYIVMCYSDNLLDYLQFQWFFWFIMGTIAASARLAAHTSQARFAVA